MRVVLNQTKNGLLSLTALSTNFCSASKISMSTVGMRSRVSGPVSSIFCPPLPSDHVCSTPRGPYLLPELRVFRVIVGFRLLFRVQVVKIAEKLVEAMHRRQVRVAVAEVVLAELAGRVALRLEQVGDGRRPVGDALRRAGHADGQQAGAERVLAQDERRPARRAALLRVGVGK